MTDRYNALTVVLEHDTRSDDAESLIQAIRHLRGVLSVTPNVADYNEHIAEERVKRELSTALWTVLHPDWPKK